MTAPSYTPPCYALTAVLGPEAQHLHNFGWPSKGDTADSKARLGPLGTPFGTPVGPRDPWGTPEGPLRDPWGTRAVAQEDRHTQDTKCLQGKALDRPSQLRMHFPAIKPDPFSVSRQSSFFPSAQNPPFSYSAFSHSQDAFFVSASKFCVREDSFQSTFPAKRWRITPYISKDAPCHGVQSCLLNLDGRIRRSHLRPNVPL